MKNTTKARRLKEGLCTDCEAPNDTGKQKCDDCRRQQSRQVRERKVRLQEAGLCQRCECESETRLCYDCYWLERDYQIAWRQKRKTNA